MWRWASSAAAVPVLLTGGVLKMDPAVVFRLAAPETLAIDTPASLLFTPDGLVAAANVTADKLTLQSTSEWVDVVWDAFDNYDNLKHWDFQRLSTCGMSTDVFLGGPCVLGVNNGTTITREFDGLPPHVGLRVSGRLHFFDAWAGETLALRLDDTYVNTWSHVWCPSGNRVACARNTVNLCGNEQGDAVSRPFAVTLAAHTAPKGTLSFTALSADDKDPCAVSWGIDDLVLSIKT